MVKRSLYHLFLQKIFQAVKSLSFSLVLMVSLLCCTTLAQAEVTASVDKQSVELGDNIQLTIYAGNLSNSAVPDLSTVVNDFDLLSSSQTQQVAMMNNRMTSETVWSFTLTPTHAGTITIPPISVGSQQTLPITVKVTDGASVNNSAAAPAAAYQPSKVTATAPSPITPQAQTAKTQDVFMKAELTPTAPYVQSQAIYTLRLFYDKQIANPQISEPVANDGSFIRIGQNEVYQKLINQQPYQVIEMKYALFPEKSGTLTIKGPTFNGNMFTGSMVTFTNANFKPVQATANTVQVTVKPIPAPANNSWWLPANDVQVSDKWSANLSDLQVGVPVTRTVKLAAQGIMASQLPNLITNNVPGFQVYPDKPQMTSSSDGSNVFGTRVETAAYIPTQAGTVTLPAIVVKWWNVQTDTMQTATIPAKTINILPAAGGASSPTASTGSATLAKQNQGTMTNLTATKTMPRLPIKSINYWVWIAGGVVVLWLLTVICWLFYRKRVTVKNKSIKMTDNANISAVADSLKQAKVRIEQAVKAQDPQLFATALIAFAQKVWPDATILSLTDIATKCKSVAAKEAIAALDKLRYSYSSGTWQAENTWQLIKDEFYIEKSTVKRDNGQLPKLYPE